MIEYPKMKYSSDGKRTMVQKDASETLPDGDWLDTPPESYAPTMDHRTVVSDTATFGPSVEDGLIERIMQKVRDEFAPFLSEKRGPGRPRKEESND